ncbi:MAG: signal peptidase I [Armatimonadota bacterium]
MFKFDNPGFPIALLTILLGFRLAVYVIERMIARAPAPVDVPTLAPDEPVEAAPEPLESPAAEDAPARPASHASFISEILDSGIIAVVLVFFLIRPFILQAFFIPSGSMIPTLQEGDKLLATKYTYHLRQPRRGEVVVFHAPKYALQLLGQRHDPRHPTDYVKRVVALPGDRVRIIAGQGVFINGTMLNERYARMLPNYDFPIEESGHLAIRNPDVGKLIEKNLDGDELVIPDDYYLVLGDNRQESHDGHVWGLLPRKALVGKAAFIFWPFNRMGIIR